MLSSVFIFFSRKQIEKDMWLRTFDETGKYPSIKKASDWTIFPTLHFRMNATLILHTLMTIKFSSWLFGCDDMKVVKAIGWIIFISFALHGGSHKIGQWSSDGTCIDLYIYT